MLNYFKDLKTTIAKNDALQKILENSSWLMIEKIANKAIRIFVAVWVIRYLGPENFGVYSYAISFVGLFTAISRFGLNGIIVRNLSRKDSSEGTILGTALLIRIVTAIFTIGLVAIIILTVSGDWLTQIAVLIISINLVFKASNVFNLWFQSKIKSKYPVWTRIGTSILFSFLQILAILLELSVFAFLILFVVQSALRVLGVIVVYEIVPDVSPKLRFAWKTAKSLIADGWKVIVASVSISIYMRIDQVMLGEMVDKSAVGIYATAVKLSEVWYFLPVAIATTIFPKIVSSKESASDELYKSRLQLLYDLMSLMAYLIIVPIFFLSYYIVFYLFGEIYLKAVPILQVHIWAFLFVALGTAREKGLLTENYLKFNMFASVLGASSNFLMNLILIPRMAGLGAAWATLFSQMVQVIFAMLFLVDLWPMLAQLLKSLLAPVRIVSIYKNFKRVINV